MQASWSVGRYRSLGLRDRRLDLTLLDNVILRILSGFILHRTLRTSAQCFSQTTHVNCIRRASVDIQTRY